VGQRTDPARGARYKDALAEGNLALGTLAGEITPMIKRKPAPTPKPTTLAQQQSDFTAEGSPPPGQVAASTPAVMGKKAAGLPPAPVPLARKGPPVKSRWQR
jgi:hypothetical protein